MYGREKSNGDIIEAKEQRRRADRSNQPSHPRTKRHRKAKKTLLSWSNIKVVSIKFLKLHGLLTKIFKMHTKILPALQQKHHYSTVRGI